ncbi:MAG: glutamyl-tRNA reductase [Proteobacteria bacterium]|nr:glutamyl-tRNA reductase [Pseudomonadota bacterium]MDE3207846.1 glutamyl-tRNA reductase [Pseudomonadota bacterium]
MQLYTLGLNHRSAPIDIREQIAFPSETLPEALDLLMREGTVREAAIISTCNRTELYCHTDQPEAVTDWLTHYHQPHSEHINPALYTLCQSEAVRHIFRVAGGLDSMVLGETQILGQVKDAVKAAQKAGSLGALLHKLFQTTFSVAKEIRSGTHIGHAQISMAAATVKLAERIFDKIADQAVLFIGAGEMIELCATHFAAQHPRQITVASRTFSRAQLLAHRFGGQAIDFSTLPETLAHQDIIITSTDSPLPILGLGLVERSIKQRRHKPMFMADLAVPRDIEPEVGKLNDVYLYSIDDLAQIVEDNINARQQAAAEAEVIIEARVGEFMDWLNKREVVPTIVAIRDHVEAYRQQELLRAKRRLQAGDNPDQVIEQLALALTKKFLHIPTHALNKLNGEDRDDLDHWLRRLYSIHDRT